MNINKTPRLLNANHIDQTNQPAHSQSILQKIQKVSIGLSQRRMKYIEAQKTSIPLLYRLSGESQTTKITKLELLERINQYNNINNLHSRSHDPIDINSPQASSWDMFTEHEIAELIDRLK